MATEVGLFPTFTELCLTFIEMLAFGYVRWIDGLYYSRSPESKELITSVNNTLAKVEPRNWSFPQAENAAIFRTYVDPPEFRNKFDDFFGEYLQGFNDEIFFLGNFVERAIGSGHLSPKFYNPEMVRLTLEC